MPKKEKYIEWKGISIPKIYYDHIEGYLRHTKKFSSVSEFVRIFMDSELKEFISNLRLRDKARGKHLK